jgi:hypothetical protein
MRYVALLLLMSGTALARDNGQWNNSPITVREWFQSLMQPDNPYMSCCGEADAFTMWRSLPTAKASSRAARASTCRIRK